MDLKLTIKKKWYDMILSGEKKEEYRDIKPYWEKRLKNVFPMAYEGEVYDSLLESIHFFNGFCFSKDLPNFKIKFEGIEIAEGKTEWGAEPNKKYFVIKLGEIIKYPQF